MNSTLCIYCRQNLSDTRDHVPSKCLLRKPYPSNLWTVPACRDCNKSYSLDEEYFRLMVIGIYSHTKEAEELFDGPINRSMDRNAEIENLMFNSLRSEDNLVLLDLDYSRMDRVISKIIRGLDCALTGNVHDANQQFDWDITEVDSPSADVRFAPDFSFRANCRSWEVTFFDSVRFNVNAA